MVSPSFSLQPQRLHATLFCIGKKSSTFFIKSVQSSNFQLFQGPELMSCRAVLMSDVFSTLKSDVSFSASGGWLNFLHINRLYRAIYFERTFFCVLSYHRLVLYQSINLGKTWVLIFLSTKRLWKIIFQRWLVSFPQRKREKNFK